MSDKDELSLDTAVEAMRGGVHEAELSAAAGRLAEKLGLGNEASMGVMKSVEIKSCEDVQSLLPDYRAGKLSATQALLIDGHLRECGACLRLSRAEAGGASKVVDWYRPALTESKVKLRLRGCVGSLALGLRLACCWVWAASLGIARGGGAAWGKG